MKTLRKNVDLTTETIVILQIEATMKGHGALKPFLEQILRDFAKKCLKARPKAYQALIERKAEKQGNKTNRRLKLPRKGK